MESASDDARRTSERMRTSLFLFDPAILMGALNLLAGLPLARLCLVLYFQLCGYHCLSNTVRLVISHSSPASSESIGLALFCIPLEHACVLLGKIRILLTEDGQDRNYHTWHSSRGCVYRDAISLRFFGLMLCSPNSMFWCWGKEQSANVSTP